MTTTPKTLTTDECEKLLTELKDWSGSYKSEAKAVRNHTMALLMLDAGLRVGEVVKLQWCYLIFNSVPVTSIIISPEIAKNKTERIIPVSQRLSNALKKHRECNATQWPEELPCFFSPWKKGYRPLTTRQVERIIRAAALKSIGRPVHPHMLRHTFGTRIERKAGIRIAQECLGHANLASTQIYTHPNQDDLKKAIEQMGQGEIETGLPAQGSAPH